MKVIDVVGVFLSRARNICLVLNGDGCRIGSLLGLLFTSRGHFSDNGCVSVASRAAEGQSTIYLRPVVTFQVDLLVIKGFQVPFPKHSCWQYGTMVLYQQKYKCCIKCSESRRFSFGGNVMHNHDTDSETCLNRHIFNNCVKRKTTKDFCERPRTLIHKKLLNEDFDTLT